jgi:hypothetical protein
MFEDAAGRGDWMAIHDAHFDWWMFPTDEPSAYGFAGPFSKATLPS